MIESKKERKSQDECKQNTCKHDLTHLTFGEGESYLICGLCNKILPNVHEVLLEKMKEVYMLTNR